MSAEKIKTTPNIYHDLGQLELFSVDEEAETKEKTEYKILDDTDLRYNYVRYTERLIAKAIHNEVDTMIFLDKSARPVAWLMRALWNTLGIKDFDESGEPIMAKMPEVKFVNFDREQWAPVMGRSEGKDGKGITLEGLHPDTVDSLTGLFAKRQFDRDDYVSPEDETFFDDRNILIVDEVSASGDTLVMAKKLFERAFRNSASIDGTHWMPPEKVYDKRSGAARNADLPVWYNADSPYGRLVGDRDLFKSSQSPSMRQRRGAQFLSYHLPKRDDRGIQLRKEMYQLGEDVMNGEVPVTPSSYRPDDERFEDLFMLYVNQLSFKEFSDLKRQAIKENGSFTELVNQYKTDRGSV